ncbi:hypothetical protein ANCDUO_11732 [Ancylostoma duodenale]|uniref:Immunoglobulin I-set domain protein n=1 Tax=Ancylostoma duodenale TaxID=51022 RepID=A0A0C2GGT4_9BILA|nr:hypothetical protein ANCDUO_11732 [Ancylostoma duodenale]
MAIQNRSLIGSTMAVESIRITSITLLLKMTSLCEIHRREMLASTSVVPFLQLELMPIQLLFMWQILEGTPQPKIQWFRNGRELLQNSNEYMTINGAHLSIAVSFFFLIDESGNFLVLRGGVIIIGSRVHKTPMLVPTLVLPRILPEGTLV